MFARPRGNAKVPELPRQQGSGRKEQPGIGHPRLVVEGDLDPVGVVAWQHLQGAPFPGPFFCYKTIIPESSGLHLPCPLQLSSRRRPVLRWIRAKKPVVRYHDFVYQAQSWDIPRRVVAKVEWRQGELFPRVGFVVTNLNLPPEGVTHFYNGRGTAEQWIKEGKYALNWTRLSCHRFVANQVRLWLFVLAYNLGNFMRRLTLPESVKHWSLRSVQTKLIKMGGRLVRHARRLVFQLAEVAVSREVFRQVLERIAGLHPAPG